MSSSKQWLQSSMVNGEDGGANNRATGSSAQRVVQEAMVPGTAVEQVGGSTVAGVPDGGVVPNAGSGDRAEGEELVVSVLPKPGEKRPWDETGGIDRELEAVVLRVLRKYNYQPSSLSSGREMVSQETQTVLTGDIPSASRVTQDKMQGNSSADAIGGESSDENKGRSADGLKPASAAKVTMDEEEVLELDAERLQQVSEDADQMRQISEDDGFHQDERWIIACDKTRWKWHHHEDGRQYYYCLDTGESKWVLPKPGDKTRDSKETEEPSGNALEDGNSVLGPISPTPTAESTRAFQGSVDGIIEDDFPSTNRDIGLRGGGAALTSGSLGEEGISGLQEAMAGGHLDQERDKDLSEGDAAVETASPDRMISNVEESCASATEEQMVEKESGTQEVGPEKKEDGEKALDVATEEVSPSGAIVTAIQRKDDASEVAGDAANAPERENGAWSANVVRAKVPEKTQTMDVKRAEAPGGTSSATDCDNGEQVVVATDEGDAVVDAPAHSEVRSEELKVSSHTEANEAAVTVDGGDIPLVTMEPKDPAVEESMPAVDDLVGDPG